MADSSTVAATTKKHRSFVGEPVGEKSVTHLAGIGEVLGKRLELAGFDKAYTVLGQFLVMKKDKNKFEKWLKDTCNASSKQSADCYKCLNDYFDSYLKGK